MNNLESSAVGYYTTAETARLSGMSPHRVARWARMGIIRHSISDHPNIYSYADVGEAILAHYLAEQGKKPGEIKELVEYLRGPSRTVAVGGGSAGARWAALRDLGWR